MKIIQIMPGRVWGGAEQVVLDMSKALAKRGHEVVIYVRNSRAVISRMEKELPFKVLPFAFSLDPRAVNTLAKELRRGDTDVVNVHNSAFVPMAILAKRKAGSLARVFYTPRRTPQSRQPSLQTILFATPPSHIRGAADHGLMA